MGLGEVEVDQVDLTILRLPILGANHMAKKAGDPVSGAVQALELGLVIWQGTEAENVSPCLVNRREETTAGLATATITTKVVTSHQAGQEAHPLPDMRVLDSGQHRGDNVIYTLHV